jgi:hypothetical protein
VQGNSFALIAFQLATDVSSYMFGDVKEREWDGAGEGVWDMRREGNEGSSATFQVQD